MLHARKDYNDRIQDSENKIPVREPVFLLRGQDLHAPMLLEKYAAVSENSANHDKVLVAAVREHAACMRAWQKDHLVKEADMDPADSCY